MTLTPTMIFKYFKTTEDDKSPVTTITTVFETPTSGDTGIRYYKLRQWWIPCDCERCEDMEYGEWRDIEIDET